jgi:hypothetical protein
MGDDHIILGVHLTDRVSEATRVQAVFTQYGCNIKTRVGLHDVDATQCSPTGVILIEFFGEQAEADKMAAALQQVDGVHVKSMVFSH